MCGKSVETFRMKGVDGCMTMVGHMCFCASCVMCIEGAMFNACPTTPFVVVCHLPHVSQPPRVANHCTFPTMSAQRAAKAAIEQTQPLPPAASTPSPCEPTAHWATSPQVAVRLPLLRWDLGGRLLGRQISMAWCLAKVG